MVAFNSFIEVMIIMPTILIVDDAAFMRLNLKNIIKDMDLEIVGEAENGKEGIKKYNELKPDLVTMDITMPVMDGIEALKKIIETDSEAKIVVCSAMGQQNMVVQAVEAGAKDFVVKPFDGDRIKNALNKAIS